MLPKRRRLSAAEVRKVLLKGIRKREDFISMKYLVNKGPFAAAVVAPKRIARGAVLRNRVRRAVYRALSHTTLPQEGWAVFLVERLPTGGLSPVFSLDIRKLCSKLS